MPPVWQARVGPLRMNAALVLAVLSVAFVGLGVHAQTPSQIETANKVISEAFSSSPVWDRLAYVCDHYGPRPAGSAALEDAIDHIVGVMNQDGLEVSTEQVNITTGWNRGTEWAKMLSPRIKDLHMVGLGLSVSTPNKQPITAPVMVVSNFTELEMRKDEVPGHIVLFDVPFTTYGHTVAYRSGGATHAEKYGAVAVLIRSVTPYGMQTGHTGYSTPATIPSAAISIEDSMQMHRMVDRGQNVTVQLLMSAERLPVTTSRNVIADLPGSDKSTEFVVIGGHIDSWDIAEGAMDDGGGAFIGWEAIRLLKSLHITPRRTIRAVMWVDEEKSGAGADRFAKMHKDELKRISIAIESDSGTFSPFRLGVSAVPAARDAVSAFAPLLEPLGANYVVAGGSGADISPLCQHGVPCAGYEVRDPRDSIYKNNPCLGFNVNNESYKGEISNGYFWFHHTAADTVDKIAPEQLQGNAAALAIWALNIANMENMLPRNEGDHDNDSMSKSTKQILAGTSGGIALIGFAVVVFFVLKRRRKAASSGYVRHDADGAEDGLAIVPTHYQAGGAAEGVAGTSSRGPRGTGAEDDDAIGRHSKPLVEAREVDVST